MKRDFAEYLFGVIAIVVGAAAEDLLPRIGPVGFPVLLMTAAAYAVRARPVPAALFALGAGAAEEAVSGLPPMTAIAYFFGVAALMRHFPLPRWAVGLAYPAFHCWLWIWTAGLGGGVCARLLAAVPMGMAAACALAWIVDRLGKAVALEEA